MKLEEYLSLMSLPAGIYLFKVNNGNNRTMCEIYSEVTIKALARCH